MAGHRNISCILIVCGLLQGCSTVQNINAILDERRLAEEQAQLDSARESCTRYGFTLGTDSFAQCVQTEINEIEDRAAISAAAVRTSNAIEEAASQQIPPPQTTNCRTSFLGTTTCTTQ